MNGMAKKFDGLEIINFTRALICKQTLVEGFEEYIDNFINIFDTVTRICGITSMDKLNYEPIMLTGYALYIHANNVEICIDYDSIMKMMRDFYNRDENRDDFKSFKGSRRRYNTRNQVLLVK